MGLLFKDGLAVALSARAHPGDHKTVRAGTSSEDKTPATSHIGRQLVGQFLTAGLDSEVLLGLGNFWFTRIAVLGNEVAGEAGELVVIYKLHGSLATHDRFAGAGKVMLGRVS
jgi:hypothetical protein